jgi:alkanesulfonate monooxygenase SsuD/methylene tetrahydromethanopterin reductase-like flavin-dependent oxidoreductase (luciferase family)
MLAVQPQSPGLADRIWWGSGSPETAVWAGEQGMNLMSSILSAAARGNTHSSADV